MRAGRLNQTIQIYRHSETQDSYGQANKTFTLLSTVRAEVRVLSEAEDQSSGKTDGRTAYRVTTRYTDINKKDRIVWNSKNLEVVQVVDPTHRRTQLDIRTVTDE